MGTMPVGVHVEVPHAWLGWILKNPWGCIPKAGKVSLACPSICTVRHEATEVTICLFWVIEVTIYLLCLLFFTLCIAGPGFIVMKVVQLLSI